MTNRRRGGHVDLRVAVSVIKRFEFLFQSVCSDVQVASDDMRLTQVLGDGGLRLRLASGTRGRCPPGGRANVLHYAIYRHHENIGVSSAVACSY